MSNISQKLTYLNETKNLLKTQINYGLNENNKITNETTFRDYVKSIFKAFLESLNNPNTLFTNLPKKSGTGANITLNDTANAPMKIKLNASEMSQSGTPTPESPQNIHTISGDNTLMVEGKNLWNENAQVFTNQALLSNPTKDSNNVWTFTSSGSGYAFAISKKTLQAGTYTFSFSCVGGNAIVLNGSTTLNNTFTLNGETEITIRVFKSGAVEGDIIKLSNVMIEKGSTATSYEPYVSQEADINLVDIEYCKIGNYEDEFIRTSGKNKCNITGLTPSYYSSGIPSGSSNQIAVDSFDNNNITFHSTSANYNIVLSNVIQLKPNTQYTIKFNRTSTATNNQWFIYDYNNGTYSVNYRDNNTNVYEYTFTTNSLGQIVLAFGHGNTTGTTTISNIMLNKGTTALPYEPYGSNEWYIKKSIGKVVLDGTESFTSAGTSGTDYRYNKTLSSLNIPNATTNNGLCISNYFQNVTIDTSKKWGAFYINGNWLVFYDKDQEMTDAATFNTWLSNNNTIVYYVLATPTYTQITGTLAEQLENIYQKLKSYKGTTNISQVNNDLPFVLNVQALEDLE